MPTNRCTIPLLLALTAFVAAPAPGQQAGSRRQSVRETERVARANWQPVRRSAESDRTVRGSRRVRVANHQIDNSLPAPANPPASVVEVPIDGEVIHEPLDGQIILQPLHEGTIEYGGTVACDALPPGMECGCGAEVCDGGCDSMGGCDDGCGGDPCCGELCSPNAWRPCVTLCLPQDGWASFQYLNWWQDGMSLPPLVTSNIGTGIPASDAGVLGRASTVTLFGGEEVLEDSFDGGRLRFGVWLDRCHTWGVGAEYFGIGSETDTFRATSTGAPILARPFFNTQTGEQDASVIAFPSVISGTVGVTAESELEGWGVHLRRLRSTDEGCSSWLFCGGPEHYCGRTEFLVGYRGLQLDESVTIRENSVSADQETFDLFDRFDTRNQFNGFDLGWSYKRTRGYWSFDSMIRLAVGNTRQTVTINGQTTVSDPNDPPAQTLAGGMLAATSNIGAYDQDEFSVVPEFNANVGYQLTDHLRLTFGYTFIYWSNIVRPGEHISLDLNPNLLPPPADPLTGVQRPEFAFDTVDYWVQGLNVGGEYRW